MFFKNEETLPVRNQGLDLLRTMAITFVLLLHASHELHKIPDALKKIFGIGWIGVDLFFVLSGFLIGKQLFSTGPVSRKKGLLEFIIKRWTRTFPLYFFVLFIYLFIKPHLGFPFISETTWSYFFFLQNYFGPTDFVQSWSLCIEEHFYLLLPFLYFFLFKQHKVSWFWPLLVIISFIFRLFIWFENEDIKSTQMLAFNLEFLTHTRLDGLGLGVFLASTEKSWITFSQKTKSYFLMTGLFLMVLSVIALLNYPTHTPIYIFTLLAVAFSLTLIGVIHIELKGNWGKIIQQIALYSYGLYLWNSLVQRILAKVYPKIGLGFSILFFFGVSLLLAKLSYDFIEVPGLKLRKKILNSMK